MTKRDCIFILAGLVVVTILWKIHSGLYLMMVGNGGELCC